MKNSSTTNSPAQKTNLVYIVLALFSVYVLWGSTYLSIRIAVQELPPFFMAMIRFIIAGGLMLALARWRKEPWPTPTQLRDCAVLGLLLLFFGNGMVCFAETRVDSGLAAVAVASMPLWAALFAGIYGKWPQGRDWIGLAIGFVGIVLLNLGTEMRANLLSAIALTIAPLSWAFGSVWSKRRSMPTPIMSTALQMLFACIPLALASLFLGESWSLKASPLVWANVMYLVVAGSILGFTAYIYLLQHVRPALATSYAYVNPPLAVLLGVWLANEQVTRLDIIAMSIILFGVVLILTHREKT